MGTAHNSPSLERSDRLISRHEGDQALGADPAIHVGDQFQGDVVDAGQAGRRSADQFWQFPAVVFWKMAAGRSNLLFDQIEVIEQPFIGRQNSSLGCHGGHHQPMGFEQDRLVLLQAAEQLVRHGAGTRLDANRPRPWHAVRADRC